MTSTTESVPDEEASHAVRVSRTISHPIDQVWQHLISPAGTQALLGSGVQLGGKGESWRSDDGTHGVMRSYHPLEQIRVSWHSDEKAPASVVDVRLAAAGHDTRLELTHDHPTDHDALQRRWDAALDRFASGLG
jgi:uncharacterized protein YndB with AHSA1/START domain